LTVDYDAIREGMAAAIPFNTHIGLEVTALDANSATVRLPDDERLHNHVGSQHAAGLFAAAEAASGGAFVGAFAERLGEVTPLASAAKIKYLKLAKGPIDARAELADGDQLLEQLDANGKVSFTIGVGLTDESGTEVARATVAWHDRKHS
jgi:acyl-coenzyme A thioesterase PaaI-like protein